MNRNTRGGTWIVSGGGRGITAVIAMTLAKKYDLKLHLLGTAPVPNLSDEFVAKIATDRSAIMDACLYAIGYAAWHRHQKPSLPVQFGRIEFGRLPDPGEPCVARIHEKQVLASGAVLDFQLHGNNEDRLLTVYDYQIGWLKGN